MNRIDCENILMAKMAELDGEKAEVSAEIVNSHFLICENCRTECEQMRIADNLLKRQTRREAENVNLWSAIEKQIGTHRYSGAKRQLFASLGAALVVYKLLELFAEQKANLIFNAVPLLVAAALFVFLKENPFKINAELNLER